MFGAFASLSPFLFSSLAAKGGTQEVENATSKMWVTEILLFRSVRRPRFLRTSLFCVAAM